MPDDKLKTKIANVPTGPGVYQYFNSKGKLIYIGKAKNLRNRVRSYFQSGKHADAKTTALVQNIADLEFIVTDSEAEALILEDTLIKKHKPRYNILLRDDKSYPYIRITNETFPRIFTTRNIIRDGSKYFGPFTEMRQLKNLMRTLRTIFRFRSCNYNLTDETISNKKYKICLDYHIDKCDGPCEGFISKEDYKEKVKQAIQIINGKTRDLEHLLEKQMQDYAEELEFEKAAFIRNRLKLLKEYSLNQKIVSTDIIDRDVVGLGRVEDAACVVFFNIREGKLTGKRHFIIPKASEIRDEEIIGSSLERWYLENEFIPKEIHIPCEAEQSEFLLQWLREKRGKTVELMIPKIGEKKKLINMAKMNAEFVLRDYFIAITKREQSIPRTVLALQRDLRLKKVPMRIECFDNSHIQGSELVSSLVVFEDGKPKKSDYRKFKVRTVAKNDDFAAMRETVYRRYRRLLDEKAALPDLIIVDGGKGQLSGAYQVLKDLKIDDKIAIIGLAKRLEEVFFPEESDSILLPKTSSSLKLIQQVRDEAHRFAITFHRQLRDKRTLTTELLKIPGIGEKTAQKLLIEFGSAEGVSKADYTDIRKAVTEQQAISISNYFYENKKYEKDNEDNSDIDD